MKTEQLVNLIVLLNSSASAEKYGECMWVDQSYWVLLSCIFSVTQSGNKKHPIFIRFQS